MRSFDIKETALRTTKQESRLKRRNPGTSMFPENVGVKENRKILLCKRSGTSTSWKLSPMPCVDNAWIRMAKNLSPDPQRLGSHSSLVQRGHSLSHLLQNRRRQRGVALRLRDFLPGLVHPAP